MPLARPEDTVTIELHRHLGWQRKADRLDWPAIDALARDRGLQAYLAATLHLAQQAL